MAANVQRYAQFIHSRDLLIVLTTLGAKPEKIVARNMADEIISFISTATVAPKNPSGSTTRIDLTPWELQFLPHGPIQKGLLFRQDHSIIVDHLKTSLSRTLDFFYPLAGRLGTTVDDDDDNTATSFFINCNGAGVPFIHATADGVTVGDFLDPVYVPTIVSSFFPRNLETRNRHVSAPLLAVQVTELVDGVFIGCTMNHVVADGASFWHFFNSWSEISRHELGETISKPPVFDRGFMTPAHFPIRIPESALVFDGLPSSLTQQRVFHFTKEKIAGLKAKANAETGTNRISSLQALLAHFWRSVTRNRRLPEDQETSYMLLIGMRARVHPPLPEQYFGAAVQAVNVTMKVGEILELGLGHTAWKINKIISTFTELEVYTNFFESWAKNPRPLLPRDVVIGNALMASSSPRFNVYGNDFGWGKPVAVRSGGGNKCDGKTTIFEGAEEGSIDIEACLSPQTLEAMMEDVEFMDAVTNI